MRGDLDNIVLKATASEPEQRYASAGAFADDIERHLAGEPVAAHPPSTWYRTHKFIARHKGGVLATVAFALAVFAALGIALWQAEVARQQARVAHEQAQRAEAVRQFMIGDSIRQIPTSAKGSQLPPTRCSKMAKNKSAKVLTILHRKPMPRLSWRPFRGRLAM